jgi:hypothetical protein
MERGDVRVEPLAGRTGTGLPPDLFLLIRPRVEDIIEKA